MSDKIYTCECGRSFNSKYSYGGHCSGCNVRKLLNNQVSNKIYECVCGFKTDNRQSYIRHQGYCSIVHPDNKSGSTGKHWNQKAWNKGLTKETDERVMKISKALSGKGHPHSQESKNKISEALKIAHKEGRASNWQDTKKYQGESYPEYFFTKVIKNHFDDQNYVREYRIKQYAIDFAWVHKKLAIEIDGQQHERMDYWIISDKKKDNLLTTLGWKVLRIRWIDMFHDPHTYIKIAKDFIDN